MTYDGLNTFIKSFMIKEGYYIIKLKYRYAHEVLFTYSNEVFFYDSADNDICWFNDWWEGQEECDFENMFNIENLVDEHIKAMTCINKITNALHDYNRGYEDCGKTN